ncbi:methyltransferase nsun5 [Lasius niger]|uniref:Methyltransferase nsun5 n=1 Tax=Lasius niger TaxID=67767 RepID=A0A0J7K037_LASNI|nr:methyltransferase nsun5 [Lasius niger]
MCAAPGMKTTHIAAKLQNYGEVYAVEIDAKRFETLFRQIKTTHSSCVKPLNQDVLTLDPKQYSHVEYILVDPTCSGSAVFERNFDVALPECKRKGGNVNPTIANLDIKKNDMVKKVECKLKQCEKKKKKKEEISTNDGQVKISRDVVELVVSQVENKVANGIKIKKNKKDVRKIDNCSLSNFNHEEITLNRSEDIQKKISEDMKQKKSKKKKIRSKYENLFLAEKDKEMKVSDCEEKELNEENKIEPPKKKKKDKNLKS